MILFLLVMVTVTGLYGLEKSTQTQDEFPNLRLTGFARVRYIWDFTPGKADGFSLGMARFGITGDISKQFTMNNSLRTVDCGIKVDDDKLNTALGNLFDNAIKFTQTGAVEFGIRRHADCLEFSIKDTGIGISVNNQHSIFNIFMQEDASDTRKYEGSGLGLPIAQAYVKMLGGDIRLESQEGQGSTFYVTFPLGGGGIEVADKQRFAK